MLEKFQDFLLCENGYALTMLEDYIHHPSWFMDDEQTILASILALGSE